MKFGRYIIIFVLFVGLMITFGNRGLWDSYVMRKQLQNLRKANQNIVHENASLKKEINLLQSNLSYIEMIARNDLGMVKQGDVVFRISK
ncbi:MAG TPA: septum formation initiator family protein [Syntrophales bacterium]|mgnify:FL=1|nr:septum formation initiator family protein [Syntrophales bacterium]HQA83203.1 septum formation initiator family protein [Syntrophales bacterium]